jgi:hypothetical protein
MTPEPATGLTEVVSVVHSQSDDSHGGASTFEARNSALRRLDWRFLLPRLPEGGFATARLIPENAATASLLLDEGVVQAVLGIDDETPADAAIVTSGDHRDVLREATKLRPHGVLYGEIDRSTLRAIGWSPRRLRRALHAAGLEGGGTWLRHGKAAADALLVPVDLPGPLPWFFEDALDASGAVRGAARRAISAWCRGDGRRAAPFCRRYAVTAVRRAAGRPALASTPGALAQARLETGSPVVLRRGEAPWSRVVMLPFEEAEREPAYVVKVSRHGDHDEATKREHATLQSLQEELPEHLRNTIPRPLWSTTWGGVQVSAESYLPGRPLASLTSQGPAARADAVLDCAIGWLTDFHTCTVRRRVDVSGGEAGAILERPLTDLATILGDGGLARFVGACGSSAGLRPGAALPIVWTHGDLTPRNMRWNGRHHAVVDWEVAREGPALVDLLYLLLHWRWGAARPFGADPVSAFRRIFDDVDGHPAREAGRQVRRYCSVLDIDPHLAPRVVLAMLAQQAVDRARRIRETGLNPRADRNVYIDLLHWAVRHDRPTLLWAEGG